MPASVTPIASFPTSTGDGTTPDGQLFIDSNGDLVGATVQGGANDIGTTYEIVKTGGGFATTPTFLADIPDWLEHARWRAEPERRRGWRPFRPGVHRRHESLGSIVEFPSWRRTRVHAGELLRHERLAPGRAAAGRFQRQSVWNDVCRAAPMAPARYSNSRRPAQLRDHANRPHQLRRRHHTLWLERPDPRRERQPFRFNHQLGV